MFIFGSAAEDRAFALDLSVLSALAAGVFFALVWLAEVIERAVLARRSARRWPR